MENTVTSIANLPIQPTNDVIYSQNTRGEPENPNSNKQNVELPTNYTPINTHPNPYGNNQQQQPMSHPTSVAQSGLNEEFRNELNNMPPQRLPSRDINQDTTIYSQDEQVRPNHIPKQNVNDYVREYENMNEQNVREYEDKKRQQRDIDVLFSSIQTPILIAFMFFIFQMPLVNTLIFKRFSFLTIYNDDGNFNFYGLLLKSILFGSVYYSLMTFTNFVSEL